MAATILKDKLSLNDQDICRYIDTALDCEDFDSVDHMGRELGPILRSFDTRRTSVEIRSVIQELWNNKESINTVETSNPRENVGDYKPSNDLRPKSLARPYKIASEYEKFSAPKETSSIFLSGAVDKSLRVDRKKLEKAEAKLKSKQDKQQQ